MSNIIDYVKWRGDITFEQDPFNEVDAVVLSQLAQLPFKEIAESIDVKKMTIKVTASKLKKALVGKNFDLGLILPRDIFELFYLMGASKRFGPVVLSDYVNDIYIEKETQFCALTADVPSSARVIIFCGTDDTIVGWREDFNMICISPTPAQAKSVVYLEKALKDVEKGIICGHSKGGNLAMYSLVHADISTQEKVIHSYNIAGPGFTEDVNLIPRFKENMEKTSLHIGQTAVVGRFFDHYEKEIVVHSNAVGLYQHDVFSWEVLGKSFVKEHGVTKECLHIENIVKDILKDTTALQKQQFVEVIFDMLQSTDSKTLLDVNKKKQKLITSYLTLDAKTKKLLTEMTSRLVMDRVVQKYFFANIKEMQKKEKEKAKELNISKKPKLISIKISNNKNKKKDG